MCAACKRWYGTAEDAIAGCELQRRLKDATFEQVMSVLGELCDVIVLDWPGVSLQQLFFSSWSAPEIGSADQKSE